MHAFVLDLTDVRVIPASIASNLIGYSQHTAAGVIKSPHVYNWKSLPEIM